MVIDRAADDHRIVVVGASIAGVRAAEELRRRGFRGPLELVGAENHFPPYDRPPLSKEVLSGKWDLEDARLRLFEELDAVMHLGRSAVGLNVGAGEVRLDDRSVVAFDRLVVATGAEVRRIACPGSQLPGVYYFRDAIDCSRLRDRIAPHRNIAVIGAGFIGSEVAAVWRRAGARVTIIDSAPRPMSQQVGSTLADFLLARHRAEGVELRLGVGVEAIDGGAAVAGVRLTDGSTVECDTVIVGIGVTPATEWLAGSGLPVENGLLCDEHCLVAGRPTIAAAGDVARWVNPLYGVSMRVEHWTNAVEQAEYAARALLGHGDGGGYASLPYFWSDVYDTHLQFAGIAGDETKLIDGDIGAGKFVLHTLSDGYPVGVAAVGWPAQFQRRRHALLADLRGHACG